MDGPAPATARVPADKAGTDPDMSRKSRLTVANALLVTKVALGVVLLVVGVLLISVLFTPHDRAAVLTGRSEVLSVRVDGSSFGSWVLPAAEFRPDRDASAEHGQIGIEADAGTRVVFRRSGRGPLHIVFEAPEGAAPCPGGDHRAGRVLRGTAEEAAFCDDASLVIPLPADPELARRLPPIVLAVRGEMTVGEAVRPGGAHQPILLNGAVSVLVRPSGRQFRWLCSTAFTSHACERYEVTGTMLAAGDEASWTSDGRHTPAIGFLRIDPSENAAGFSFDIAAAADALTVTRLRGETFQVEESVLDRMLRSPLAQSLGAIAATLGTIIGALIAVWHLKPGGAGALILLVGAAAPAHAQQVFVEALEQGQATLMARADRCQAVTLEHVVGRPDQADRATEATIIGPGRIPGDANVLRRIPSAPEPLVVLEVQGPATRECPRFAGAVPLDALLHAAPAGQLRMVRPDGGVVLVPLRVQAVDFDLFLVRFDRDPPARGMSGGTVLIEGRPAGLLADVDATTSLGRVARMDRVLERLAPWFAAAPVALPRAAAPATREGLPVRVLRWSVPPLRPQERAEGVLEGRVWRVAADRPADLVLQLPEGGVLSGVSLDVTGLEDPPRAVEVLAAPAGAERWASVGVLALEPGDTTRRLAIAPRRAGLVMLRLVGAQSGQASMALAGVALH